MSSWGFDAPSLERLYRSALTMSGAVQTWPPHTHWDERRSHPEGKRPYPKDCHLVR